MNGFIRINSSVSLMFRTFYRNVWSPETRGSFFSKINAYTLSDYAGPYNDWILRPGQAKLKIAPPFRSRRTTITEYYWFHKDIILYFFWFENKFSLKIIGNNIIVIIFLHRYYYIINLKKNTYSVQRHSFSFIRVRARERIITPPPNRIRTRQNHFLMRRPPRRSHA